MAKCTCNPFNFETDPFCPRHGVPADNGRYPVTAEALIDAGEFKRLREEILVMRNDAFTYAEALRGANLVIATLQERLARWQARLDDLTGAALAAQVIDPAAIELTNGGNANPLHVLEAVAEWLTAYQASLVLFQQTRRTQQQPDPEEVAAAVEALTEAGWHVNDLGGDSFVTLQPGIGGMMDVGVSPLALVRRARGVL
jgi:hypothetical protein